MHYIEMRRLPASMLGILVAFALSACAPAGHGNVVAAARAKPIHRTDQFEAVAATASGLVAGTLDGLMVALDFYRKVWVEAGDRWVPRPISTKMNPVAMTCDSANRLWIVGSRTGIVSSAGQSKTWTTTTLGKDAILSGVHWALSSPRYRRAFTPTPCISWIA